MGRLRRPSRYRHYFLGEKEECERFIRRLTAACFAGFRAHDNAIKK
jgi:hypothetical protein